MIDRCIVAIPNPTSEMAKFILRSNGAERCVLSCLVTGKLSAKQILRNDICYRQMIRTRAPIIMSCPFPRAWHTAPPSAKAPYLQRAQERQCDSHAEDSYFHTLAAIDFAPRSLRWLRREKGGEFGEELRGRGGFVFQGVAGDQGVAWKWEREEEAMGSWGGG